MGDALNRALAMPLAERRERWESMWDAIQDRSPIAWGRAFVASLLRAASIAAVNTSGDNERPARANLTLVQDSTSAAYASDYAADIRINERGGAERELTAMMMPEGVKLN